MSNKLSIIDITIGVECFGNDKIDVKECLSALGIPVVPNSETDPGFEVNSKRLHEDNCGFNFEEEDNGVISYSQNGPLKNEIVTLVIEVT